MFQIEEIVQGLRENTVLALNGVDLVQSMEQHLESSYS